METRRSRAEKLKKKMGAPKAPTMKELTKNFDEFMKGKEYSDNADEHFQAFLAESAKDQK